MLEFTYIFRRVWSHLDESTMVKVYIEDSLLSFYVKLTKIFSSLRDLTTTAYGVKDSKSLLDLQLDLIRLENGKSPLFYYQSTT
jgi:hypothetical protein